MQAHDWRPTCESPQSSLSIPKMVLPCFRKASDRETRLAPRSRQSIRLEDPGRHRRAYRIAESLHNVWKHYPLGFFDGDPAVLKERRDRRSINESLEDIQRFKATNVKLDSMNTYRFEAGFPKLSNDRCGVRHVARRGHNRRRLVGQERSNCKLHGVEHRIFRHLRPSVENQLASRPQDSFRLPKGLDLVWKEHRSELTHARVELPVPERQVLGVCDLPSQARVRWGMCRGIVQHRLTQIGGVNRTPDGKTAKQLPSYN